MFSKLTCCLRFATSTQVLPNAELIMQTAPAESTVYGVPSAVNLPQQIYLSMHIAKRNMKSAQTSQFTFVVITTIFSGSQSNLKIMKQMSVSF